MAAYTLVRKLGAGGMGTVYLAVQHALKREVAVKVLKPDLHRDEVFLARFNREIKVISQLTHPNVVRVFDWGELDGQLYFAMELAEGENLDSEPAGDFPRARRLLEQAADALAYIHGRGLVHRDVKPANFVVDKHGRVILLDFGLARTANSTVLTEQGTVLGTPRFLAPELISGAPQSAASDVHALACTAHELLSGKPAIRGDTLTHMMVAIVNPQRPSLAGVPGVPEWFLELQRRAFALDPAERPSAAAYRDALRAGASASRLTPPVTAPSVPPFTRRHLARAVGAASALAIVLAALALRDRPAAPPPAPSPAASVAAAPPTELAERAARSFLCLATERSVVVDLDAAPHERLVVEVGRWADRDVQRRAEVELADDYLHQELEGLTADTEHFVRVRRADGPPLISDYRFRTRPVSYRAALDAVLGDIQVHPVREDDLLDFAIDLPDRRTLTMLTAMAHRKAPAGAQLVRLCDLARKSRDHDLAAALMDRLPGMTDPRERAYILSAGIAVRMPSAIAEGCAELDRTTDDGLAEVASGGCIRAGAPHTYERIRAESVAGRVPAYRVREAARLDPAGAVQDIERLGPRTAPAIDAVLDQVLAEVGTDAAVRVLARRRSGHDAGAQLAGEALAEVNTPSARGVLLDALSAKPDLDEALFALFACARAGPDPRIEPLLRALADGPPPLRRAAVAALAASGSAAAVSALRAALRAPDPGLAPLAAWALAALAPADRAACADAVRPLAHAPADASGLAAWALARLAGPAAEDELLAALDGPLPDAHLIGVAFALADCGSPRSATRLRALAADRARSAPVRDALARAADLVLGRAAHSGTRTLLVPAGARAVRAGLALAAGESVDASATGYWGAPLRRVEELTGDSPPAMALTALQCTSSWRVDRRPLRLLAVHAGELAFTPYPDSLPVDWFCNNPVIEGFAVVTLTP